MNTKKIIRIYLTGFLGFISALSLTAQDKVTKYDWPAFLRVTRLKSSTDRSLHFLKMVKKVSVSLKMQTMELDG